ncbi:MAG: hypothetical protein Q8M24_15525 [Pseudolabrys sp.]|nr:hypothetical protein [Pseudolabrys sp.]
MSVFLYGRKALGGRLRVGAAVILNGGTLVRLLSFLILIALALAALGALARAHERSPCLVFGQPVPCQNFISSNPAQNKIRDEDLARRLQRDRDRDRRRDINATKDQRP